MIRGPMGCLWAMIKPALFVGVFVVIGVLAFPWAVPLPGRPALTGGWTGELRSGSGPPAWLYMNLQMASGNYSSRLGGSQPLGKDGALCTRRRRIDLRVAGVTTAWSGKSLDLLLMSIEPSRPELQLDITGKWDGHELELRKEDRSLADALNEPNDVAAAAPSSGSQWIAATLRRGTRAAFDSACATLAGRR